MIDNKKLFKMWANSVKSSGLPNATKPTIYNVPLDNRQYLLDEEVTEMEKAMTELFNDDFETHQLIKLHHVGEMSCNKLARAYHCRSDQMSKKLSNGENFVRGLVFYYFKDR